ncbi:MAG: hypothetical protein AAF870_04005 [Pseudomonadota bacterium]
MSKFNLAVFALGVLISLYGIYAIIAGGEMSSLIFIFGGIVITAIAAGLIGKAHSDETGQHGE